MPPATLRNTKTTILTHLTPGTTITIPINMAHDATSASISSISTSHPPSKPTTRRRPTALRSSLLAQIGPRKTYITTGKGNPRPPTNIEAKLADREREKAKDAAKADPAAAKREKEKASRENANVEKRNRVGNADDEGAKSDFNEFGVSANSNSKMDMNISSGSTDTDGSVVHDDKGGEEDDVHAKSRTKLLVEENQTLAKRVEALEAETSSLLHMRALEHDRLKSINAALISKLANSRASAAEACAEAKIWEGQMMDRDGEVQRLRALLTELQEEVDDRHGSWEASGSQALS